MFALSRSVADVVSSGLACPFPRLDSIPASDHDVRAAEQTRPKQLAISPIIGRPCSPAEVIAVPNISSAVCFLCPTAKFAFLASPLPDFASDPRDTGNRTLAWGDETHPSSPPWPLIRLHRENLRSFSTTFLRTHRPILGFRQATFNVAVPVGVKQSNPNESVGFWSPITDSNPSDLRPPSHPSPWRCCGNL